MTRPFSAPNFLTRIFRREKKSKNPKGVQAASYGFGGVLGGSGAGDKTQGGTADYNHPLIFDHQVLRQKSRAAVHDSPALSAIESRKVQSVIDTGIRLAPNPSPNLSVSEGLLSDFRASAERFNVWMSSPLQHRREALSFLQAQGVLYRSKLRDGEAFLRLYYRGSTRAPSPLQWEMIDADQICGAPITSTVDGETYLSAPREPGAHDGIMVDRRGRPVRYNIRYRASNGVITNRWIPARAGERLLMLHAYAPDYPFQRRGFPTASKVLQEAKNLQDFAMANIIKAKNQANQVYAVENKIQDPSNQWAQVAQSQPALMPGVVSPAAADSEEGESETEIYTKQVYTQTDPGSATLVGLQAGDEIKPMAVTAPVETYSTFVRAYFDFISAALNVPPEVALMEFSANYSASRAALIMFWRVCEAERQDLDIDIIAPVYEMWLAEEIGAGRIRAPGWEDSRLRALWTRHNIVGAPMPTIDPNREAQANIANLAMGGTSPERVAHNLNGSDAQANFAATRGYADDIRAIKAALDAAPGEGQGDSNNE